jgi:competence protein ComEC
VSGLPGATLLAAPMPASSLALFSAGAAWLALWRRPWRLFGLAPIAAAILLALAQTPPDLLLAGSLKLAALRQADGRLHQSWGRGESGLRQAWARFDGVEPPLPLFTPGNGLDCDDGGCWVRRDQRRWRVPLERDAMAAKGTHLVWLHDGAPPTIHTVADWRGQRPWSR